MVTDVNKGIGKRRLKFGADQLKFIRLTFGGEGTLSALKFRTGAHMENFLSGAAWFLKNQDQKGGWAIGVPRVLAEGRLSLQPPWYSAMAQGHGISVLVRAHHVTGDEKFLNAAKAALKIFEIRAENGGILSEFMGIYPWYEEYPTVPGTFVLNGFTVKIDK